MRKKQAAAGQQGVALDKLGIVDNALGSAAARREIAVLKKRAATGKKEVALDKLGIAGYAVGSAIARREIAV